MLLTKLVSSVIITFVDLKISADSRFRIWNKGSPPAEEVGSFTDRKI